jgi:predicted Zn finger-like uncharacterized protein
MISLKCPHCHIKLKVDESKLPQGIDSFKCPKCKKDISVALLNSANENSSDTVLLHPINIGVGRITVIANQYTPEQVFPLREGKITIGRDSASSDVDFRIQTKDKMMSRNHVTIEVKKDSKGRYKHYLSDNNSKNRTLYNNNYLEADEVVVLNDKDVFIIGCTCLRFNV